MLKRKLQIFLSSTYEDLIDHRLAAMEAILAAGHIPAAMEQFTPGDETAWEKIKSWIDESDAFILILGGRYGSIEPESGKSYVELEYEYALAKCKPYCSIVVTPAHHAQRVKEFGLPVDERENPIEYKKFRRRVEEKHCGPWTDKKDIKFIILQRLSDWSRREDLSGWIRADEAADPRVVNELAELSRENRELRTVRRGQSETFEGLNFEEMEGLLAGTVLNAPFHQANQHFRMPPGENVAVSSLLDLFDVAGNLAANAQGAQLHAMTEPINALIGNGLMEYKSAYLLLTNAGRRFRNRRLSIQHKSRQEAGKPAEGVVAPHPQPAVT